METFYIRVRGRVLGPYDSEKLKSLAVRGQLSKMHEVSVDGVSWVRASTYPELFEGKLADYAAEADASRDGQSADGPSAPAAASGDSRSDGKPQWHYAVDGKQMPPTDLAGLQQLAATGVVTPETQVWQEGMRDWMPATSVAGLSWPSVGAKSDGARGARDDLPKSLRQTALGSRGWAMFLAILGLVAGASAMVFGIVLFLLGISQHVVQISFSGMGQILQATLLLVGSWFLLDYAISLGELHYASSSFHLTKSLAKLRRFWMFTGITTIVVLAIVTLFIVFVFTGMISLDVPW